MAGIGQGSMHSHRGASIYAVNYPPVVDTHHAVWTTFPPEREEEHHLQITSDDRPNQIKLWEGTKPYQKCIPTTDTLLLVLSEKDDLMVEKGRCSNPCQEYKRGPLVWK